jgi:NitT/TauT family transport system permease protein
VIRAETLRTRPTLATLKSPNALRILSVLIVVSVWEFFGRQVPLIASYPSAIGGAFIELTLVDNRLVPALAITLVGLAVGFAIAAVGGVVIGFAMARNRLLNLILDPYMSALYATPRIALIPLLVLWFGVGFELRVTVVVLSSIFPIIINVYAGVRDIDRDYLETARAFAASRWQVLHTIDVPASLPFVFAGLRIGVARALIGITVAEMTAAVTGTGALLIAFGRAFATDRLFVPVVILGFLSIALAELVHLGQRRAMPWRRAEDG